MNNLLSCNFNKLQSYIVFSKSKSFFALLPQNRNFVTDSLVGVP